jgi:hypothetical protein
MPDGLRLSPPAGAAQVRTDLRRRILRAFVGRGLLQSCDAKEMLGYQHSGFSVDAGVLIEAVDRAALERLLRNCARPPFAIERLRKDELRLTPLELIDRIAALVPPPRTHRPCKSSCRPNQPPRARAHPRSHRCRLGATTHIPGARATIVG